MKTIEEKAKEYAENIRPIKGLDKFDAPFITAFDHNSDIEEAYKKGAQDTQRWIPVEEELPEKQGFYFVIAPKSFPKNCKVVVAEFYEDNNTFYSESSDCPIEDATHWRPIEY